MMFSHPNKLFLLRMSVFDIGEGTVCKGAFNGKHYQTRIIARGILSRIFCVF